MRFTRLILENWRNFKRVDVELRDRMFVVGPNAAGKSNLLDAFRFLRDVAQPGGLQAAVLGRHGVSHLRSLYARQAPDIVVEVHADIEGTAWRYRLAIGQDNRRSPLVKGEQAWRGEDSLFKRPGPEDTRDPARLGQTHLEQVSANREFRAVAEFFAGVRYLHLVPQLIREPERYSRPDGAVDPHGADFLETLARAQREQRRTFDARLRRINGALQAAVPQLKDLTLERDAEGRPHLRARYEHWRPRAGRQSEAQFSDGTLRLIGLLWSALDGRGPLLLEEPELSLHEAVVRHVPAMIWKATRDRPRQVILSTHSRELLSDRSIAPEEVLLLSPTREQTEVSVAVGHGDVRALLEGGLTMGEAVLPRVAPSRPEQLLFGFGG